MQAVILEKPGPDALDRLRVASIVKPHPGPNQLLVRNTHTAINPVDWKMAEIGFFIKGYPCVLGCDLAGVVEAVGEGVTSFSVGQKVYGYATLGTAYGSFGEYSLLDTDFASVVPANISPAQASTVPVGSLTASLMLFHGPQREIPSLAADKYRGQYILVWGGASSVGSYAIQLAKAAGYTVIAVCSAASATYVSSLGADYVADYRAANVIEQIRGYLNGATLSIAADAVGQPDKILPLLAGSNPAHYSYSAQEPSKDSVPANVRVHGVLLGVAYDNADLRSACKVYAQEINNLIAQGNLQPNQIEDAGKGLDAVPAALKLQKQSSGKKIVVTYP